MLKHVLERFDELFDQLGKRSEVCLTELIQLLSNWETSKDPDKIELVRKSFDRLIKFTTYIDQKYSPCYPALSLENQKKYRMLTVLISCLYFYADKVLNTLAGTPKHTHNWETLSNAIVRLYEYLAKEIHQDINHELYFTQTLMRMITELADNPCYLTDQEELGKILRHYSIFKDFAGDVVSPLLKSQCQIYLFSLETDNYLKNHLEIFNQEKIKSYDTHYQKICSHLESKDESDDKLLINKFALLTKIYNILDDLYTKIDSCENPVKDKKKITY